MAPDRPGMKRGLARAALAPRGGGDARAGADQAARAAGHGLDLGRDRLDQRQVARARVAARPATDAVSRIRIAR